MGAMDSSNLPPPATHDPAIARPDGPQDAAAPRTPRRWLRGALILLLVLGGIAVWKYPDFKAQAEVGAAYAARVGCSCRYVQERSLESCQSDFEPGMEMVSISDDAASRTVTGSVPLLASRSARFAGATGCLLNPAD